MFGAPVVHGVHAVLWALETQWPDAWRPGALKRLKARFSQPIRVDAEVRCVPRPERAGWLSFDLMSEGRDCVRIECHFEESVQNHESPTLREPTEGTCAVNRFEDLAGREGRLPLLWAPGPFAASFPRLTGALPAWQLAVAVATSRLCGMVCPGLHSLLAGLDLEFNATFTTETALRYRVTRTDDRFALTVVELSMPGLRGEMTAFFRPSPVQQASLAEIRRSVGRGEFARQRALVVGGSRGLGEVTAKIVAAGGGQVWLTYRAGEDEAARVVEEIRAAGGEAWASQWDVADPPASLGRTLASGWHPTHLYYFPTPYISLNETTSFSRELFRSYAAYYVEGFVGAVEAAMQVSGGRDLRVFFPSSSVLDEVRPQAMEYAAAKAAGEAVCLHLQKLHPRAVFRAVRLPRMLTDRTASVVPTESQDPVPVMLDQVRALEAADAYV